jgi:hypothetical protein
MTASPPTDRTAEIDCEEGAQLSLGELGSSSVRRHARSLGFLVIVGGILLLLAYGLQGVLRNPFRGGMDATIYAATGFRLNDPSLYQNDPVIPSRARDFPTVFYALLPDNWESLKNVGTTYVTLGLLFGVLFGVGIYLLIHEVFGGADLAVLVALIAMLANRGLMQTPCGWGVRLITPRFAVMGLSPLLLWLYWRWRDSWRVAIVFGALGLLLLVHPRFSVYPATLLGIGLLLQERPSVLHWARVALRVSPFVPFLVVIIWLAFARLGAEAMGGGGGASVELSPYDFPAGLLRQLFFSSVDAAVPLCLGVAGWVSRQQNSGIRREEREGLLTFTLLPIAVYAATWLGVQWAPALETLHCKRFLTWAYLVPYGYGASWILDQWQQGSMGRRLLAVAGLASLLVVTSGGVRATLLDDSVVYRRMVSTVYDRFAPQDTREGHDVVLADAGQAADIDEDWQAFYKLCAWARLSTDKDAVFVIPPRNFSLFRLYSQRSLYTMARNITIGSLYASGGEVVWERYQAATAAYAKRTSEAFEKLDDLGRTDYVVVEKEKLALDLPVVYENRRYRVYAMPDSP